MKKCIFYPLLIALLLWCMILPAAASGNLPHVIDNADLMTNEEVFQLEEKASSISDTYEMDIVILTVDSLGGKTAEAYADDYYDGNGYGYGEDYSGVLFLLSMEERDWYISTCGSAVYVLTDYGIQQSADAALPYLSAGDYAMGFYSWLDILPEFLDAISEGAPIDGYADYSGSYYSGTQEEIVYYEEDISPSFLLALLIGAAAGGITIAVMRSSMNTRRKQSGAREYMNRDSYRLRSQRDIFLYSNVTRTARPKQTSSGSGGGSSVHRSSSGRSHGGGGGKF